MKLIEINALDAYKNLFINSLYLYRQSLINADNGPADMQVADKLQLYLKAKQYYQQAIEVAIKQTRLSEAAIKHIRSPAANPDPKILEEISNCNDFKDWLKYQRYIIFNIFLLIDEKINELNQGANDEYKIVSLALKYDALVSNASERCSRLELNESIAFLSNALTIDEKNKAFVRCKESFKKYINELTSNDDVLTLHVSNEEDVAQLRSLYQTIIEKSPDSDIKNSWSNYQREKGTVISNLAVNRKELDHMQVMLQGIKPLYAKVIPGYKSSFVEYIKRVTDSEDKFNAHLNRKNEEQWLKDHYNTLIESCKKNGIDSDHIIKIWEFYQLQYKQLDNYKKRCEALGKGVEDSIQLCIDYEKMNLLQKVTVALEKYKKLVEDYYTKAKESVPKISERMGVFIRKIIETPLWPVIAPTLYLLEKFNVLTSGTLERYNSRVRDNFRELGSFIVNNPIPTLLIIASGLLTLVLPPLGIGGFAILTHLTIDSLALSATSGLIGYAFARKAYQSELAAQEKRFQDVISGLSYNFEDTTGKINSVGKEIVLSNKNVAAIERDFDENETAAYLSSRRKYKTQQQEKQQQEKQQQEKQMGVGSLTEPLSSTSSITKYSEYFYKKSMQSDGNCLFHAVVDQLSRLDPNSSVTYIKLREQVVAHIKANESRYINLTANKNSFADYLKKMSEDGQWGDELEIQAMSELLNVRIQVLQPGDFQPDIYGKPEHPLVYLAYNGRNHYDSLIPCTDWQKEQQQVEKKNEKVSEVSSSQPIDKLDPMQKQAQEFIKELLLSEDGKSVQNEILANSEKSLEQYELSKLKLKDTEAKLLENKSELERNKIEKTALSEQINNLEYQKIFMMFSHQAKLITGINIKDEELELPITQEPTDNNSLKKTK